jgi:signal transduction histidine kinase
MNYSFQFCKQQMRQVKFIALLIICILFSKGVFAQTPVVYQNAGTNIDFGSTVQILEDKEDKLTVEQAIHAPGYVQTTQQVPNLEMSTSAFWIKFAITNLSQTAELAIEYPYPTIDSIVFVEVGQNGEAKTIATGEYQAYYNRLVKHQNYIFNINIPQGTTKTFLLKVRSSEQIQLPLTLGTTQSILESIVQRDFIFGLYAGIILVMLLYNLFVYFTVRDNIYLNYVLYILFVGLTQACVQGYAQRLFYPSSPYLANLMMVVAPVFVGVTALAFLKRFMALKEYTPVLNKVLNIFLVIYGGILVLGFLGYYQMAAQIVQINAGVASLLVFSISVIIARKGYKPAKFFLIAWTIFLASVIVFVLRNFNVLPYNTFTYYALQIGSALEVILLSFALADKINMFRKEKEESQAQAFLALQENARIVSEQNVMLETKVAERTLELNESNQELSKTLVELKEAEMQLVESEKMASLGQLTAGIAHEINNPINFVTSNVKPLQRDIDMILDVLAKVEELTYAEMAPDEKKRQIDALKQDYDFDYLKTEIGYLLKGINEGSSRTAEIVKGLRIFSRLDEDDLKKADINEGLDSTTIIVNNLLDNKIEIVKQYDSLPLVDCYPGKLNQVFLNIITNGIHALKSKFQDQKGGVVTISTRRSNDDKVIISIKDNGTGMTEQTKKKLFEPFFTTKDVGEGTGLGLSIAYNTIKKHNGTITVESEIGVGTEFIIEIPIAQ